MSSFQTSKTQAAPGAFESRLPADPWPHEVCFFEAHGVVSSGVVQGARWGRLFSTGAILALVVFWFVRAGVGRRGDREGRGTDNNVLSHGDHAETLVCTSLLPLCRTYCTRVFDVSGTRRAVRRVHAFCEQAENTCICNDSCLFARHTAQGCLTFLERDVLSQAFMPSANTPKTLSQLRSASF